MQEDKYYNRKYEACVKLILDEKPFDKNLRRILAEVYPDEVVQTLYDVIIYEAVKEGMTDEEYMKEMIERGAKLYYLNDCYNYKLQRGSYAKTDLPDQFLLYCIVIEMKSRRPELTDLMIRYFGPPDEQRLLKNAVNSEMRSMKKELIGVLDKYFDSTREEFAITKMCDAIYKKYRESDFRNMGGGLEVTEKGACCRNFDTYFNYLTSTGKIMSMKWNTFTDFWGLLWEHPQRRTATFASKRPNKDELYLFCLGAALDYEHYRQLKSLMITELVTTATQLSRLNEEFNQNKTTDKEKMKKAKASLLRHYEGSEQKVKKLETEYQSYDDRDILLEQYLKEINTRLNIVYDKILSDKKNGKKQELTEYDKRSAPWYIIKNVNSDLVNHRMFKLMER